MKRSFLLTLFVIFMALRSQSQASLGFINVTLETPSVALNDTLKIRATLFNFGSAPFTDSLVFGLLHNGTNIANPAIFPRPYPGPPVVTINPNDSLRLNMVILVTNQDFIVGPTGVVIWPVAMNQMIQVHDSLNEQFTVTPATGIQELSNDVDLLQEIYLDGALHVTTTLDPALVKEINLYAVTGQLLFRSNTSLPLNIPVNNYATGVFLLQLRLASGEQITRKVLVPR